MHPDDDRDHNEDAMSLACGTKTGGEQAEEKVQENENLES
jgi:hypothetical protein